MTIGASVRAQLAAFCNDDFMTGTPVAAPATPEEKKQHIHQSEAATAHAIQSVGIQKHHRHHHHHHHHYHEGDVDTHLIHKILSKRPEVRTVDDVDKLFMWVTKNNSTSKLFAGIQDVICKNICREMTLLIAPPNTVVCYQGDFGDVVYIILAGQVALYVNEYMQQKPFEDDLHRFLDKTAGVDGQEVAHETFRPHHFGKFVAHVGAGNTVGELAVMELNTQRTCTVVSTMMTSFICLKRGAYQRLARAGNGDLIGFTPFEFIKDLFLFESWNHAQVQNLSAKLRQVTIPADSFVLRHGNEANSLFFICSGVVQETVPMLCLMDENGIAIKYLPVEDKSSKKAKPITKVDRQGTPLSELKRKRVSIEIALFEAHDVCGEQAIVCNQTHSKVDLRAVTDVKALAMDVYLMIQSILISLAL
ncbi:unnamed protein product [Aphanomyces euteiches]